MPLRLEVGLQQKVGLPDYGSLGAACHVELELDSQLLDRNPDAFRQEVEKAFATCRHAVQAELNRHKPAPATSPGSSSTTNGRSKSSPGPRRATPSQLRALRAIATRQQFDLAADLERRFGIAQPEDLDLQQASRLIDELNRPLTGSRA